MKLYKLGWSVTVASLAITCLIGQAFASQTIIPHRGLWKNYSGTDVAENSVSSYKRAKDKGVEFIEIDLRMAKINNLDQVVVFHDNYWNRAARYNSNGDNWGHKQFVAETLTTDKITNNITNTTFNGLTLKRNGGNGSQHSTDDKPLRLNQFLLETICKYQSGPKIILDVQSVDVANVAADIVGNNFCPKIGTSQLKYSSRVSLKLFAHRTVPAHIIDSATTAENIPQAVVNYYNNRRNTFNIYFQFNSGSFNTSTCISGFNDCDLILSDGGKSKIVKIADFRKNIMKINSVAGVALSAPPIYQDTASSYRTAINNTMNHQLTWFDANRNGKKLISIGSRPDDRKLFTAKGEASNTQSEERCFMYNYKGDDSGRISFYTSDIYSQRNAYANNSSFDYIIVDAYIRSGNVDWDEAREVELLCGNNKSIVRAFMKRRQQANIWANSYKNLTQEEDRTYTILDVIKGRAQIEQYFTKK